MQSRLERAVPSAEHQTERGASTPDWDGVRIFLEVARRGSFRSAADHLGQSVNVLRRRLAALEQQMGTTLLTRHVDGVRTTAEGAQILAAAQQMEIAAFGLSRARDRALPALSGEVKLAVTEGLGTFWLAPRLVEFQRAYPRLLVDLSCAMRSADVLRLEADAAVQLTKPTAPDLKVIKLGRLHAMPFASASYLETYGTPKNIEEVVKHRIVLQVAEQLSSQAEYERLFPGVPQPGFVAIRTNVSSAHYWSIAKGAGIGMLPTYAEAIGARVIPIGIGLHMSYDIWLTYHVDANRIPRVRRMIDWLIESFDPRQFPWFRDEFIPPQDLPKLYRGQPLVNLFEGFAAADGAADLRKVVL
jgi:DNA-binding transcriptional LysR family regulator